VLGKPHKLVPHSTLTFAAIVRYLQVAFLDVNVRGAILAHGTELYHVAVRRKLLDGVQKVDGAHDVVGLCVDGPLPVYHAVRCRALLTKVHDGFRLKLAKNLQNTRSLALHTPGRSPEKT
jgi:hypothetical protein